MKKIVMLAVAGMFSISTAAMACDGMKKQASEKTSKSDTVAKKDTKADTKASTSDTKTKS